MTTALFCGREMKPEPFVLVPRGMCPFRRLWLLHLAVTQTQSLIFLSLRQWDYVDGCAGCCHHNLLNWVFPQPGRAQSLHFPAPGCPVLAFQPTLQWFCGGVWEVMSKAGVPEI